MSDRKPAPWLKQAGEIFDYTKNLRRDLHRHPELGFQELRTAGIVARELNQLGLEVTTGVGRTGVVALLEGAHPGPTIMLRFDMDALPIQEETGADYASQTPGVMHACGHDGHVAVGLTVARLLHERRAQLPGMVKLVFQPAEEGLGGAEAMIADGVLGDPRPDIALGMHLWNEKPLGWLGISPGPVMAAAEYFKIQLQGVGGHGAKPQFTVDPVLAAAHIVTALQSVVSRNVAPLETAVVTVGALQAGDTFNVIPARAVLEGTIRTFEPLVRDTVLRRFREIVTGVSQTFGCQVEIDLRSITPALVNQPGITHQVQAAAREVLPDHTIEAAYQTMTSEDMAFFQQEIPGCYLFVGSANPEKGLDAEHHHPRFDFDEQALPRAAALVAASAVSLLKDGERDEPAAS